ncbi:MAG: DUF4358 domain-containing protein [Anaerovoracaceae bacterium]|jgi:ABC-type phosphate/phosphonate transport system substrate-binding protein
MKKIHIKVMLLLLAAAVAAVLLTGCGSSSKKASSEAANVNLSEFVSAVENVDPVKDPRKIDDFALENELGLEKDNISKYKGVITNSQDDCALIFIAKTKSGKTDAVKDGLETYRDGLTENDLYAENADKIDKAKEARVEVRGNYVIMVIAGVDSDYSRIDKAIDRAFES